MTVVGVGAIGGYLVVDEAATFKLPAEVTLITVVDSDEADVTLMIVDCDVLTAAVTLITVDCCATPDVGKVTCFDAWTDCAECCVGCAAAPRRPTAVPGKNKLDELPGMFVGCLNKLIAPGGATVWGWFSCGVNGAVCMTERCCIGCWLGTNINWGTWLPPTADWLLATTVGAAVEDDTNRGRTPTVFKLFNSNVGALGTKVGGVVIMVGADSCNPVVVITGRGGGTVTVGRLVCTCGWRCWVETISRPGLMATVACAWVCNGAPGVADRGRGANVWRCGRTLNICCIEVCTFCWLGDGEPINWACPSNPAVEDCAWLTTLVGCKIVVGAELPPVTGCVLLADECCSIVGRVEMLSRRFSGSVPNRFSSSAFSSSRGTNTVLMTPFTLRLDRTVLGGIRWLLHHCSHRTQLKTHQLKS